MNLPNGKFLSNEPRGIKNRSKTKPHHPRRPIRQQANALPPLPHPIGSTQLPEESLVRQNEPFQVNTTQKLENPITEGPR